MTAFLRLLSETDKALGMLSSCRSIRAGLNELRVFDVTPESFSAVPGASFVYWVSDRVLGLFDVLPEFESEGRTVKVGLQTGDDFRFVRCWWEVEANIERWPCLAKGGSYSPFYSDIYLVVNWIHSGKELYSYSGSVIRNPNYYFRPGLTWPSRPHKRGAFSHVQPDNLFSHTGTMVFLPKEQHWGYLALLNSDAYIGLLHLLMPRGGFDSGQTLKYEVGYVKSVSLPCSESIAKTNLSNLAKRAWALNATLDTVKETSHAFLLPEILRHKVGHYEPTEVKLELVDIKNEIDDISFNLYGISNVDRSALQMELGAASESEVVPVGKKKNDDNYDTLAFEQYHLLSWAIGVVFGRFDLRLATGEREAPPEPRPFDALPAKSPGMLPDGDEPFHPHAGILVDDPGHPHDLIQLIESILERVDQQAPDNVRRWLQRDIFKEHLKQYSKSRRKAPIYWPLATTSGSYTLWVYYPDLDDQTLYTAINDFLEPKLKLVGDELSALEAKSNRSAAEERELEKLQDLHQELIELRDRILEIAPTYKPNHDDGVQITAAPLWPLFRHKPWQKVLKDTWEKLEAGEYDWAHLAYSYWPERVREKCKTDKSLAIAHGLEELYEEPAA